MGTVVTINKKCDRCGTLYGSEQTSIEDLIKRTKEGKEGEEPMLDDPVFRIAMVGEDGKVVGHEYRQVCSRCRTTLSNLVANAGPNQRPHRSQTKKNGKSAKGKKSTKEKEA